MAINEPFLAALEASLLKGRIQRRDFLRFVGAAGLFGSSAVALAETLDEIRANQEARGKSLRDAYDYIVCGSGSAGCALVNRLAADPDVSILLVEAGDWDSAPAVADPRVWFTNLGTERDWGDIAEPSPHVNQRAIPEHMGRVVGGGSSINATIWARPFKKALDHWADVTGDPAWGYEHGLSIFRRLENWRGTPDGRYRGKGGEVWCQPAHDPAPLAPAMLKACRSLGMTVYDDLNGLREERDGGFALMNQIIKEGLRHNMAQAYLYPVLGRKNVTLLINTHVDRLRVAGGEVQGVELVATVWGLHRRLNRGGRWCRWSLTEYGWIAYFEMWGVLLRLLASASTTSDQLAKHVLRTEQAHAATRGVIAQKNLISGHGKRAGCRRLVPFLLGILQRCHAVVFSERFAKCRLRSVSCPLGHSANA